MWQDKLRPGNLIRQVGNALFFLLLLVLMVDPGNAILHLKDKVFVLFVGFNMVFFKPDFRYLAVIVPVFCVIFLCYLLAVMQENNVDYDFFLGIVKGFAPLVLLLWVRHYDVLRLARIPAVITCLIILTLYSATVYSDEFRAALFMYSKKHNEMVMLTERYYLGFHVFGMYYRSIVSLMPVLCVFLFSTLNSKPLKLASLLCALLMAVCYLVSGTRAMFLTPFAIFGGMLYLNLMKRRKIKYLLYPLLVLCAVGFLILIYLLATQEGDLSNSIKYGHLTSYLELFDAHTEYLLLGQGPGTLFYSVGFGRMTAETEWTYIELIRYFGIFSLIILAVYLFPLTSLLKDISDELSFSLGITYIIFLLVGGTNPFLLNSQGMMILWLFYSYMDRKKIQDYTEKEV